jgi:hypothetical protein
MVVTVVSCVNAVLTGYRMYLADSAVFVCTNQVFRKVSAATAATKSRKNVFMSASS